MYIPTTSLKAAQLGSCEAGLFTSARLAHLGTSVLFVTDQDWQYAITLDEDRQPFLFTAISRSWSNFRGTLVAEPRIEVDPTTIYDSDRRDTALGDIVMWENQVAIAAQSSSSS